ncbi:MAG TPA: hypothetical protein VK698_27540 [Kofleriaceae bacterium]|nr:hypothetical protein [Kofleriaceae bacterium]
MKRTITTTLVGAAAMVALAAAGAGCKKEETAGQAGTGGAQAALPAKTGFAVFPATSSFIGGVNFASLRSSALFTLYKPQIDAAMASSEMAEFKAACGFDPLTQIQSLVFGGDVQGKEVVLVAKGVGRAQIKTCGEKLSATKGKKFVSTDEGNLTKYDVDNETVWAAWLDENTVVFSPEKDKDFVAKRATGDAGLAEGAEVMGLLKNVDTSATLYIVAGSAALAQSPATAMVPGVKGFFASVKLGEGLDVDAGIRFDTPDNAKKMTDMAQQQIAALKGQQVPAQMAGIIKIAERAEIKQNANDMLIQLKISNQELKELGAVVQQMGAAFGGLGGSGSPL